MEEAHSFIMSTINKGDLILITGATGYIGSNVADQALEAGYKVRGTTRSKAKGQWLNDLLKKKYGEGRFELVEVPDMTDSAAYDDAVKGVSGIIHLASILTFSTKVDEVIQPTVKAALNVLTSATKEPLVKSIVFTSSSTAALSPQPNKKIVVTADTWNNETLNHALSDANPDGFSVYAASKTAAEQAVWKAVKETQPPFQVAAVLPNMNMGSILKPGGAMDSSTGSWPLKLFGGDTSVYEFPPQYYVNVKDDARLHIVALIDPECNGKRIFAFAAPFNWNDVLAIFRKQNPGMNFPEDGAFGRDLSEVPNAEAERLLKKHYGKGWTSLEESLEESTAMLKN